MSTATLTRTEPATGAPLTPIPFARLVRVEWRKSTDTRSARWLIGLSAAATVLIMLAPLLARHSIDQTVGAYFVFSTMALATLLPVVSILTLTTEWSQRTVLSTFTQVPRRGRVLGAKISVALLLGLGAAVFGAVVTAAAVGLAEATGRHVSMDLGPAKSLGFVTFILLNVLMGVAFGALLHNSAAAIVLFFLLPTAFGILGAAVHTVGRWIDPGTTFNWVLVGQWGGHGARIALTALIWIVVPLGAGVVRTLRREIT